MNSEKWQKIKAIFNEAVELAPAEAEAFLQNRSGASSEVLAEVRNLLAAEKQNRFEKPIANLSNLMPSADAENFVGNRIGNYRIVRELGYGGMGTVFLAVREDLQKQFAVKIIRHEFASANVLRRFQIEREILAKLTHANIAQLLDGGRTDAGAPYLVMEYVEGEDLINYAERENLSVEERLKIFRKICSAVAYAHSKLIVHRDLKPSNILVTKDGEPKLLDFGISKLLDEENLAEKGTATALGMMTPNYASPEQFRGESVTTGTDVYSLGVILYELLTGALPYETTGKRIDEVARAVIETEPERPSAVISDFGFRISDLNMTASAKIQTARRKPRTNPKSLRGDLDNIILKALRKEPERRYSSIERFSEDIRRHLEGLPVSARPDTFAYRAEKFIRRNFVPVASAALVFTLLIAAVAAISWQYARAERQRILAEKRFADVRELANAFVFKYHDEVKNLPGSTKLRETMVKDALVYLDRLAADESGDALLKTELAQAFMKIGDAQGQAYDANLGDTAGAIESYAKAVRLLEDAAEKNADLKTANELLTAYQKFSSLLGRGGDEKKSAELMEKSVRLAEKLHAANSENSEQILRLSGAYLAHGDSLSPEKESERIIEIYRKALELAERVYRSEPGNPTALRRFIGLNQRLGFQYFLLAKSATEAENAERATQLYRMSLPFYRNGLAASERQFAVDRQNAIYRRTFFAMKMNVAQVERETGETDAALRAQRECLEEFATVAETDAANFEAKSDLAQVYDDLALTLARRAEFSAAFENHRRAVQLMDEAVKNDANNKEFWRARRDIETRYGDSLLAAGEFEKAAETYRHASDRAKAAPMMQDAAWQNFFAVELYEKLGDVKAKIAEREKSSSAERRLNFQAAQIVYQEAVNILTDSAAQSISGVNQKNKLEILQRKINRLNQTFVE